MQIEDAKLQMLADYMKRLGEGKNFPKPCDFDITEVWPLAGYISLIDIQDDGDGPTFRFALYGTKVAELYRRDHHGKYLEELPSEREQVSIRRRLMKVLESRGPEHSFFKTRIPRLHERKYLRVEDIMWPMSMDDKTISRVLVCSSEWDPVEDPDIDNIPDQY